jgi:tetratricopeptide (TPR) repeat protein
MSGIKLPLILLIVVLGLGVFLFFPSGSKKKPIEKKRPTSTTTQTSDFLQEAKAAFSKGDYDETIALLENHRQDSDYEIQRMLGYSYAAVKRFDDAIVAFEKTMESRRVPENGFSLAYLYEITGRNNVARMLYEDLLSAELPPRMQKGVYEGLSRTSVFENNTKAAIKYNMAMIKRYPDSPEGFVALLKIMRNTGHLKGLENLVTHGDKFHEANFEYNFWLGVIYFESGDFSNSLKRFRTCIEIDPENSTPYYYTYRVLKRQKNIEQALADLEKYHKLNPLLPHIFFEAAIDAKNEGRLDLAYKFLRSSYTMDRTLLGRDDKGAMRAIERMIKASGSEIDKRFFSGFINYINGDHKVARDQIQHLLPRLVGSELENDAKRILRECELLDQQEKDYQGYLARLERQKRLQQQALLQASSQQSREIESETEAEIVKRKAMTNPDDLRLQYTAGLQLARLGQIEDAKRFLENALRLNPNVLEVNYSMAKILMFQENNRRAREYLDRALKTNPNNSQALSMSAALHLKERDFSRAQSDAEGALKANPNNGEARLVLAEIAMRNNDFRLALKEINRGLEVEKDQERRQKLMRMKKNLPY